MNNIIMHLQGLDCQLDALGLWLAGNGEANFAMAVKELLLESQLVFWIIVWLKQ